MGSLIVIVGDTGTVLLSKAKRTQENQKQTTKQFSACQNNIQDSTVNFMCQLSWAKDAHISDDTLFLGVFLKRRGKTRSPSLVWVSI